MKNEKLKQIVGKLKILYVEDDPDVLLKTSAMFQEIFKTVDTAKDGQEALALYNNNYKQNSQHYDIVISDINMPVMNGTMLSQDIKKINSTQIIVIISAHKESDILQELINIGVNYFIHKPIKFDSLIDILFNIDNELLKRKDGQNNIDEVVKLNHEFESLLNGYNSLIITSRADLKGEITYVSQAFEKISGYKASELIGHNHSIMRHPDMSNKVFKHIWETIKQGKIWKGKIKNKNKGGGFYWTKSSISPFFDTEGKIIGYNAIREDITAHEKVKELHKRVNLLLENANDGYMLVNKYFKIEKGYSSICLKFFNKSLINDEDITELLFQNDSKNKALLQKGLHKIFNNQEISKKELFLSLLPTHSFINGFYTNIKYKIIDNSTMMVILRDITPEIELKSELERKQKHHKMAVNVITNIHNFIDIQKDFETFLNKIYGNSEKSFINFNTDFQIKEILQELHTFKGLFHQLHFTYTPDIIHNLESFISEITATDEFIYPIHENVDIKKSFKIDLDIIKEILGEDYISEHKSSEKNKNTLTEIKYKLQKIINDPVNTNFTLQSVIAEINSLSYISVIDTLKKNISSVSHLSDILEKPLHHLEIHCKAELKVPPSFKYFFRNLIHLYKNSIDHGIEDGDSRLLYDKEEKGKITTECYYENNHFHLIVEDDGNGIDIERFRKKALEKNLITLQELTTLEDKDILPLIFKDNFSTKNIINHISGRGIGMASVKKCCDDLGGTIAILNSPYKGLKYHFTIPMTKQFDKYDRDDNINEQIQLLESITSRIKEFFKTKLSIDILDSRFIDNTDLSNRIITIIDIGKNKDSIKFALCLNSKIIKHFTEVYFNEVLEENETFEHYREDIATEIINTLVGLAIQDFPKRYLPASLGIAKNISKEKLYNIVTNNQECNALSILLQTNYGNVVCQLIFNN